MPRVAILFDNFGPYHLARLTAAAGVCELLAVEIAQRSGEYAWDVAPSRRGFQSECLFEGTSSQLDAAAIAARLDTVLGRFKPEVVAVPGWASRTSLGAVAWGLKRQVPMVVMSESQTIDEPRSAWREAVKRQVVGSFSAALVGGRPHAEYLAQLGMARERVFLGYDAVDNSYFAKGAEEGGDQRTEVGGQRAEGRGQKSEDGAAERQMQEAESGTGNAETLKAEKLKAESRNKHGLPKLYFLASARFVEKKNIPRLIEAYALYRKRAESRKQKAEVWDLVVLGDGPLKADLCRLISDLSLQDSVHLPGFKQYPDLPAYYGLASAFIHASTTEQWGLVVNEAMASGLPVLVSNRCGCAADLVQEGVNGFTFDPFDTEQLAQLMLRISAFNFPLSAFGSQSQRIIADWGPERFASGLKQAVECALSVGPAKPTLVQRAILKLLLRR